MYDNIFTNDPIIKQLSQAYLDILNESHTRSELEQLDVNELKALVSEYSDKAEAAKDEMEAKKHRDELKVIKDILKSRGEQETEDDDTDKKNEKNAQEHEDDMEDKTKEHQG